MTATGTKDKPKGDKELETAKVEWVDPNTGEITMVDPAQLPELQAAAELAGYEADAGGGFENQTQDDWAIPFLNVAQPTTPECQGEDTKLRAGMLFNRTTGEIWSGKDGMVFIPAVTQHEMVEWIPKNPDGTGGGYVGSHAIDSDLARKVRAEQPLGVYKHPQNGNDLVETYYVTGLVVNIETGAFYPAILPFASTFIKPYQAWMFKARSIMVTLPGGKRLNPPLFAHRYRIRTEQVKKGSNTWYIPSIVYDGSDADSARLPATSELYREAKAVRDLVQAGQAKRDTAGLAREGTGAGDANPTKSSTDTADAPY